MTPADGQVGTATPQVAVIGEVLIEISADQPFQPGLMVRFGISGDALTSAAAAAASGARTALITRVGDDELGQAIIGRAGELGIDTSLIKRVPGQQGVYFAVADPSGQRQFAYARRGSAACTLSPDDLAGCPVPDLILSSGIACAISASAAATVAAAARWAPRFVLDPNFRPRLTSAADAARTLASLAPLAAVVTPSAPEETQALLGTGDPAAAASALRGLGAGAVAVTCGADGVLIDDGQQQRISAAPAPVLTDQTGAGDVFAGTLAGRLALGDTLAEAARLGVAAASLSLAGQGGTGLIPTLAQTRTHAAGRVSRPEVADA
jgi:2-dehydro-3-deoxygluconokinase